MEISTPIREKTLDNLSNLARSHKKISTTHRQTKSYSNISILTTKTDDYLDKIKSPDKKYLKITPEESIFETLKMRGLLDSSLEKKINEFNTSLLETSKNAEKSGKSLLLNNNNKDILKLSLINECKLLQNNNIICNKHIENLCAMKTIKSKKIDILDKSLRAVKTKFDHFKNPGDIHKFIINKETQKYNKNENPADCNLLDLKKCQNRLFDFQDQNKKNPNNNLDFNDLYIEDADVTNTTHTTNNLNSNVNTNNYNVSSNNYYIYNKLINKVNERDGGTNNFGIFDKINNKENINSHNNNISFIENSNTLIEKENLQLENLKLVILIFYIKTKF